MTSFVFERLYPWPQKRLFDLHENPGLLASLQDPRDFRLLSHSGHIRPGSRTAVRNRLGPIWFTFVFEHDLYEPPHRFGERLVQGPFSRMRHIHEFEARGEGTLVRDHLEIRLPFWMGGILAERWIAGPHIRSVFSHRQEALASMLSDLGSDILLP